MNSTFDKSFKKFLDKGLKIIKQIDFNEKKFENKIKKEAFNYARIFRKKTSLKDKNKLSGFFMKDFLIKNPDKVKFIDANSKFSGWGFLYEKDIWTIIELGQFKNGELNGYGFQDTDTILDTDGEPIDLKENEERVYNGLFKNGKRHGLGTSYINGEPFYIGEFKNNQKQGYGIRYRSNKTKEIEYFLNSNETFWGHFDNDEIYGLGTIISENKKTKKQDILYGFFGHNYVNLYYEYIKGVETIHKEPKYIEAKFRSSKPSKRSTEPDLYTF